MGCNWFQVFNLDWKETFVLQSTKVSPAQQILHKHPDVFQNSLGTLSYWL